MRVHLFKFDLMGRDRCPQAVEDKEASARGPLIYGSDIRVLQLLFVLCKARLGCMRSGRVHLCILKRLGLI